MCWSTKYAASYAPLATILGVHRSSGESGDTEGQRSTPLKCGTLDDTLAGNLFLRAAGHPDTEMGWPSAESAVTARPEPESEQIGRPTAS